jgi:transcriptional regulator of acetoin/glycerol metabolism
MIQKALHQTGGNMQEAAKILGISRTTLWRKLRDQSNH